eukprot:TRINITY_DN5311_c0_g1_i1.p1 TRINITY_DN5311_c0_g1~~TRINITY_DN5311_c0_g1_i1.p1  ORF type:complete len:320 (-),score=51.37 TRINITY_DN5311_c0_g1_i1:228-1187(-)
MLAPTGYEIVKKLAHGGQADVYKAAVTRGNAEHVVVKIFHCVDAQAVCHSELRMLTVVQGHRNIVRLIEGFASHGGVPAIVLELYARDLEKLALKRRMREAKALDMMRGVLCALRHVHSFGIVHRDVKPDNVAVGRDGVARLMDFGTAAFIHDQEKMRVFAGTMGYIAPEMLEKKAYGFPVDIFAFGATLYFALGQKGAFDTTEMTPASIAVKTKKGVVSFDGNFDHVSGGTQDAIRWLMHETPIWRPTASEALSSAPFAVAIEVPREDAPTNAVLEEPEPHPQAALVLEVRAPSHARERPARPAPRARVRPAANGEAL